MHNSTTFAHNAKETKSPSCNWQDSVSLQDDQWCPTSFNYAVVLDGEASREIPQEFNHEQYWNQTEHR